MAESRVPGSGNGTPTATDRRLEHLLSAERVMVTVRWPAVVFAAYLVATYGNPAPEWVPTVGYALVAVLLVGNVIAAGVLRRIHSVRAAVVLVAATLITDTLVVGGFVWLYSFDATSVHFLLFFVLPAEAALKFHLAGALGVWAGITAIYTLRQLWAEAAYGIPSSTPSIVFRMGILLIVSGILGLFARRLYHRSDELAGTLDRLQREEQWRSALINMLAHDFRSPAASTIATLEMLDQRLDSLTDDEVRSLISAAMRHSRSGMDLADDLLTLARAKQDHLELQRTDVDVAPSLQRMVERMGSDDSWVTIDVPRGFRAQVDPARFEQVVVNLLSNARRHGRPPVTLSARPLGDSGVEVRVSDSGEGVSPEHLEELFTQFASGPRSDSVGLGLWLVDVLATAHGGEATYISADGSPTFIATLPGPSETADTAAAQPG